MIVPCGGAGGRGGCERGSEGEVEGGAGGFGAGSSGRGTLLAELVKRVLQTLAEQGEAIALVGRGQWVSRVGDSIPWTCRVTGVRWPGWARAKGIVPA